MNIFETIIFGFYFGVGLGLAWSLFQILVLLIREACIRRIYKKILRKKLKPNKPKGMEFGKFND